MNIKHQRISSFTGLFILAVLACSTLESCFKAEIKERDYPFIVTLKITDIDETGATAHAEILNLGTEEVIDHGFYYRYTNYSDTTNLFSVSLGALNKPGKISARIDKNHFLGLGVTVLPYAKTSDKIVYGNAISFVSESRDFKSWKVLENFPGQERSYPASFSVDNNYGYIGIGGTNNIHMRDLWRYNAMDNNWLQVTSYPIESNLPAVFVIDSKAYVGTGRNKDGAHNAFYEFDSQTNIWKAKQYYALPNSSFKNWGCVGFAIGNFGYIGSGYSFGRFFYKYNPEIDSWSRISQLLPYRYAAIGVAVGNSGYVGTGYSSYSQSLNDFWEYKSLEDYWHKKADFPGGGVYGAIAFVIKGKIYLGLGFNERGVDASRIIWEYNPATDVWRAISLFPGNWRYGAAVFVINDKAYIGLGRDNNSFFKDFWVFDPSLL